MDGPLTWVGFVMMGVVAIAAALMVFTPKASTSRRKRRQFSGQSAGRQLPRR
jgi:hypothetical protein